jgi:inhibitor of cysteine peptidase
MKTLVSLCALVMLAAIPVSAQGPIEVARGKVFSVTLESNHTTGFRWQIADPLDQTKVRLVGKRYDRVRGAMPGQGGKEVWTFRAVSRGRTQIMLNYVRPWEKGSTPAQTKNVDVVIY